MDSTTRVFCRNSTTVYREEGDGGFLLDPDSGLLRFMNRTAREIYLMLDGHNDLDAIVARLKKHYPDVREASLRHDAASILQEMAELALISTKTECCDDC